MGAGDRNRRPLHRAERSESMIRTLRRTWNRLLGSLSGRSRESDLAEELESHIQLLAEENIRRGVPPRRGLSPRQTPVRQHRINEGELSRSARPARPRYDRAGSPLCVSRDPQESRFRRRRDPFARHRHRRQHRHLLAGQCRAPPAARLQGAAASVRGSRDYSHCFGRNRSASTLCTPANGRSSARRSSRSH